MKKEKVVIGRREVADLIEFGLSDVKVKVDTGAYSSSIHVSHCQENNGVLEVKFLDETHPSYIDRIFHFKEFRKKRVKSSTGQTQERYFIYVKIHMGGKIVKTEFSLTERNGMRFPILIGRKLLNNRFIVDTSLKHLHPSLHAL